MRLTELHARFTQVMPLATGIFTGLYFRCVKDPRGKKGHAILFDPPIVPAEYIGAEWFDATKLTEYLATSEHYRASPKWTRSGETLETLTLSPSVAFPCCHWEIANGEVSP